MVEKVKYRNANGNAAHSQRDDMKSVIVCFQQFHSGSGCDVIHDPIDEIADSVGYLKNGVKLFFTEKN